MSEQERERMRERERERERERARENVWYRQRRTWKEGENGR